MYSNDISSNPDDCGGEALQGIGDGMRAMMDDPHGGTEVLFIRHAESRNNVLHAEVGARYNFDPNLHELMEKEVASLRSEDADLSEKGFVQAERLGEYLAERLRQRRVLVVTSPMQRAIKTIRPLVTRLGIGPEDFACYGRYFEVGGCYLQDRVYTGTSRAELEGTYKLQCFDVEEEGWYAHSKEREGHPQALLRCEQAWLWIQDVLLAGALPNAVDGDGRGGGRGGGRSYDTIVVVGHGEFMHYVMKKMVGGGSLSSALGFVHGNTGISTLQYHPSRGALVRSLNVLEHLPPSLRTGHALADGWWEVVPRPLSSSQRPLIHRFENLPEEEPGLHMATQAIRQRYLPPSLPPYLTDVDAHSVHFLALSHGQASVVGLALYDVRANRLRQVWKNREEGRGEWKKRTQTASSVPLRSLVFSVTLCFLLFLLPSFFR
ncbi:Histidine phosphatase superfamily, clade-1 [Nannochloropsis gaditana]|uniref:Histidine phosphatase superfamily, clade-1 n=1 Tax=Nannochloropsis gaditana TaxID=72520 RepID=W7T0P3_9STRA|nr:Histidine phosphatase superfamily, clade-1 [Nannochloropsis gaditana]